MIRILLLTLLLVGVVWAEPLDRIVAVVNDDVVLESELVDMERTLVQQLRQREVRLPPPEVLRKQVLERLIIQKLQLQQAARIGIRVGDDSLNAALRQIADNNDLSLREFHDTLEQDGYVFVDFRETIRTEMTVSRLRKSEVEDKIVVSDREIDNFLATQNAQGESSEDEYHILHILIGVPESALPELVQIAQAKLDQVVKSLAEGEDFSEVASAYSDGQNALEGGDIGWRKQGELPSIFADIVPNLAIGEVSDVIRSGSGFHLVKLVDRKSGDTYLVKQTLASHILIKTNELTTDEDAQKRLIQLRERVVNGDDFAELARANSDDTGSAIEGGSLGWSSPGAMVPEFEEVMDTLDIGEVSGVFKSRFGWHLIKLDDRREEDMAEEYKRGKARAQIHKRKVDEELETWLRQLRDEAHVEYRDS